MDRAFYHQIVRERISEWWKLISISKLILLTIAIIFIIFGSTYSVWNVSQVKINDNIEFPTTDDHSKWGVGDSTQNWICVGDINRAVNLILNYL